MSKKVDSASVRSWNSPEEREGPSIPYKADRGSNPVLRGWPLAIAASIIASSTYIQSILWRANKFDKLKDIPALSDYAPRFDPTVVPVTAKASVVDATVADLPLPRQRASKTDYYTCTDYHELYKTGKTTPTKVVEKLLLLIRRDTNPPGIHSVAFLDSKVALITQAAAASTARYASGKPLSVLDGVPIAIKDEADVAGYKRTLGSKLDFTNPTDQTAWCVAKWEEAGGIVIGKTNMHELGLDTTNNNPNTGTPLNPHNRGYYTGGSSGGSAYVAAAGLCPITLGVDGGGSIRLPASFCGVYGLKPSHGRVSGRPTRDLGSSVGVYGPIASSIDDLALAYRIMAQPDASNRQSAFFPNPLSLVPSSSAHKKTLGIFAPWIDRSDPAVHSLFDAATAHYSKSLDYEVVDITLPLLAESQKAHALTILSEIRCGVSPSQIRSLTYHNQLLLNVAGAHATAQDFLYAQRLRELMMRHLAFLWQRYPRMLIVTPTTPAAGWKIQLPADVVRGSFGVSDGDSSLRSMEYVFLANWTGCPAVTVPMGYVQAEGGDVPVGLMAMGEWGSEEQLLEWAKGGEGLLGEEGIRRPTTENGWADVLGM